jgi:hypothetical protein
MNRELSEAVRELRLDPSEPVRVYALGMVVELRAVGGETGCPAVFQARVLERVDRLMALARVLGGGSRRSDA